MSYLTETCTTSDTSLATWYRTIKLSSGGGCWSYEPGKGVMPPPSAAAPGSAGLCSLYGDRN
ncbi:MAG TPA: hypothetical protein VKD72_23035, partial [Gemmataceae bacterium]|nr:hypothetical protein [Gemmataceae bacterium]